MAYTIKEVSDLAGISTRTIRFYGEIGLLSPAYVGDNGYRYYDKQSLLQLQQILFFRDLEIPLKEIGRIMALPDFNPKTELEKHRISLVQRVDRMNELIETIDKTIEVIKGNRKMTGEDIFRGFDTFHFEEEVKTRWGDTPKYEESQRKWSSYSDTKKQDIKEEGDRIIEQMVGNDPMLSPNDPSVQTAIGEYFDYLNKYFYTCDLEFLLGLADMWVSDARFTGNFERIREGGAEFIQKAVQIYCDRNSKRY